MKTSKVAHITGQSEEDCGVWLDTVQLKGKAKKKRSARPISKLLNPLADGAGYNVAVALNFTQTKMEMPKTKQSSISNFFTGQRRVLKKMATTGASNIRPQAVYFPSEVSSESMAEDWCDVNDQENDLLTEPVMWWEKEDEGSGTSSQNTNSDFKEESLVLKKQVLKTSDDALPSNNCDKHKLIIQSQKSVQEDSELNLLSIPSQSEFNAESLLNAVGKTSTQNAPKRLSLQNDKENSFPKSPKKIMHHSHLQSLSKNTKLEPLNCLNEESKSPKKWATPKSSPLKKQKWQSLRDSEDECLSMLFTQDSQGFRVIAHRGPQTRSPFKDQSNVSTMAPSEIRCLEEDEDEEEMLFTQDSQGNMVIKH